MADHLANTTDTRVVIEFGRALQDSVSEKLRNFSGDAIKGMDYSARKGKSLVRDEEELIDAADAERALVRGSTAVVLGMAGLVPLSRKVLNLATNEL
jgi:microsomal dipeptidase-like Zn-dependent dipeptidase